MKRCRSNPPDGHSLSSNESQKSEQADQSDVSKEENQLQSSCCSSRGSEVLRCIVGANVSDDNTKVDEFFQEVWQRKPVIYRRCTSTMSNIVRSSVSISSSLDVSGDVMQIDDADNGQNRCDGKTDEMKNNDKESSTDMYNDPLHRLINMGYDGLASILQRSRQRFDEQQHPDDSPISPPIFFQNLHPLSDQEVSSLYHCNPFAAYLDGCSIVFNHVDWICPYIARLCLDLQQQPNGFPHVYANAYLTPPHAQAVPAHADDRDVLIIQILGPKNWRVYGDVPIQYPYPHEQVGKNGIPIPPSIFHRTPLIETTLQPGDVLYMPRGYVHEASTSAATTATNNTNTSMSFHVTIAIATHDWTLSKVLSESIRERLDERIEYRMAVGLKFGTWDPNDIPQEDKRTLQDQLDRAFRFLRRSITIESVSNELRTKYNRHNDRAFPIRMALIQEQEQEEKNAKKKEKVKGDYDGTYHRSSEGMDDTSTTSGSNQSDSFQSNASKYNIIVGPYAASMVTMQTAVRAGTPEERDLARRMVAEKKHFNNKNANFSRCPSVTADASIGTARTTTPSPPPPPCWNLRVRDETADVLLSILQSLRTGGQDVPLQCTVKQLRSLVLDNENDNDNDGMACDLSLLSFARCCVEWGAMAVVNK